MRGVKAKSLRAQARVIAPLMRVMQRRNNSRQVLTSKVRHVYQLLKGRRLS